MSTDFATCDLCDAHKNDSDGAFRVLPPVFRDFGGRARVLPGPISTVKCFEDNSLVKAALRQPGQGRVLVVDGGASLRRALVGGNLAAAAARNGWAGVLVDGAVRDLAELARLRRRHPRPGADAAAHREAQPGPGRRARADPGGDRAAGRMAVR